MTIPKRQGLPYFGSLLAYNRNRLDFCMRVFHQYGERCLFHFGPYPVILLSSAPDVQRILVEDAYAFTVSKDVRRAFSPLLGNGLLISEGDVHKQQRKRISPLFQPRHIASYAETIVASGQQLQQTWGHDETIDLYQHMTKVTMSIIVKLLFGADIFAETDELGAAMKTALEQVNIALSSPFHLVFGLPRRTKQALTFLRSRMQQMINDRRSCSEEKGDLLSLLLRARDKDGKGMSDEHIMDEMLTLFFAGHETISAGLTWTWYLLCQHQEIYRKLRHEVDSVLKGHAPTYADLEKLPYCLQVFKEALRVYPPIHAIVRWARQDVEALQLRKGDTTLISPYVLHHRADYFPKPEAFDPERFAPEREKQIPRYAYLPFGAGPRICIGNHLTLMEGHLFLATLAQSVTFDLVPGQHVKCDGQITLRPKHGIKAVVKKREPLEK